MSTSSDNNAENQPSTSQAAFFPLLFGNPGNKPAFNDVDTEQLIASFSKLETNLNNNGPEQSTSKRAQSTEPLTTNLPYNGEKDKEQRPIIQLKRSRFNKTPNSPQQQQKHQSPQQQQQQQSSQQQTQEPKSPEQQQYQSPQQQHQSPEQQPQQAERQHNLSIHTLPSFNVAPKEPSPTTENSQPDNLTIQEKLATCFIFTPQDHDPSHSLATIFYQLETIRPSTEWHQITILCLGRQNLMQLDHLDEHFPLLEQLDVSHNELKTLSNLPNSLINLYASDNKLTDLEISNLDKLQHLDITHNKITTLDDISRLKSLRVIDASNNSIASCKYFVNLPGLTKLSLRNNALRRLTSFGSVQRPNQLETLDISFNRIECLDSIENLAELRNLNAEHNDIKYVQLTQPLERLCKLQLGFNRLKSFDVSSFPDIRTLYLDDNTIQRIIGVACIPRIESFSLRDQGGNKVEYNIQYLRGARKLYLSGSPFHNMERLVDFYSLEYLELCAANIEVLPVEFSKHVPNLSTLYLSLNRISDIRPLRKLKYLKRLVMIENRLVSVNEVIAVIQHLKQLTYLDLRQNPISTNIYPSVNINLIEGDKISPYVSSALDESWEKEDQIFCTGLSPQWLTRRKVYRALITQKCSKLVELDHIQISQQDRLDSDLIIDSYRKANSV